MKQGYKTTEFWLSLVAVLIGAFMSSGAVESSIALQGLGVVSTALAALGYSGARAFSKSGEAKANAIRQMVVHSPPKK
jgi:hypothetical protein|tara:strand:- start:2155 stop:2388 length:234 start_codon:yes stop_codon:yes gene_type:complete